MARRWWMGCVALAALAAVCGGVGLAAALYTVDTPDPPPRGAAAAAVAEPELSTLVIPVRVPISAIRREVEASLPDVLVDVQGKELEGGLARMDLKVVRAGDLVLQGEDEQLRVTLPIDVTAKVYAGGRADRRKGRGKDEPEGVTARASVAVDLRLDLALADDWRLTPQVTVSHRWLSTPTVRVGPLELGVEKIAERQLADAEAELGPKIAKRMAEKSDTRERVQDAWDALRRPAQVSTDPPTWLVTDPERLLASNPRVDGDDVVLRVGVEARFSVLVGGEPALAFSLSPLPARAAPTGPARFSIAAPVLLSWQHAGALVSTQLVGQSWSVSGVSIQATGVELYPSGDNVVLALAWGAHHPGWDTDGVLYLSGRPVVEDKGRTLRIVDFEAVVDTWDKSISTPAALGQSTLEEEIAARLVFPIGDQLDAARAQADAALQGRREGVNVRGEVASVEVRGVVVTDDGLRIDTRITGEASLESRLLKTGAPQRGGGVRR